MPRKFASMTARLNGLGFGRTKPRKAKNAAIAVTSRIPENGENTAPAEQFADRAGEGSTEHIAGQPDGEQTTDRHLALIDRHEIADQRHPPRERRRPPARPATTRIATSSGNSSPRADQAGDRQTTRHTFISRVLPKKSATPSTGCISA